MCLVLVELYGLMYSFVLFFLVAFGVGSRLHDPQLTRLEAGEADII